MLRFSNFILTEVQRRSEFQAWSIEKMSQPDLFPPNDSQLDSKVGHSGLQKPANPPAPVWAQRLSIIIFVVFCFYVGLLLFLLPWTRYWQENHYLLTVPALGPWMSSGIARGIISGLGLLDVWIGITEIIHYQEHRT